MLKKNGAEQKQIDELKVKLQNLESLLNKNLANVPPAPPITPKSQPKTPPVSNPTDFIQELKDKQSQGKLKPSEFK